MQTAKSQQCAGSETAAPGGVLAFACHYLGKEVCKSRPLSILPHRAARLSSSFVSLLWLALVLSVQPTLFAAAPAPDPVRIIEADGKVEVMRGNSGVWDKASLEAPYNILKPGDQLRTGERSRAAVQLSNQSVVRVGEGGQIQVLTAPKKRAGFSFIKGLFYFFHRDNPDELDLQTPTVSAVVRGTEFNLQVAENGTTVLSLIDGLVAMENAFGKVDLVSGDEGRAGPGKGPERRAMIEAVNNIIQWCLYYPGVLNLDELDFTAAERQTLAASINAYKEGDLVGALDKYPAGRQPASDAEKVYFAAILLSVGQAEQSQAILSSLAPAAQNAKSAALAQAIHKVIAAVKLQSFPASGNMTLATEWLAESYSLQSRSDLEGALKAAYRTVEIGPNFGFGWTRVAELEFSFGRIDHALKALDKGLQLSPRNAQALALKGFLLSAQNRISDALAYFERAIAMDGSLGNAWLGRGLCRIRKGDIERGRQDLEIAAALEPKRAALRSYLGKAYSQAWDNRRAERELTLAKKFDPQDPTPWLYSALIKQQDNRINEAIHDLEKSQELNKNRSVYRSSVLLDQDRAVRGANLASIYRDANMTDVSVREAMRAVNYDYASYSAHLFLAGSYNALRDPRLINLRYETPWLNEYLMANLLADVRAGTLSPQVTQQEYSKLFERDRFGLSSSTDYQSRGDWLQSAVQYGIFGNSSYAAEVTYGSFNGHRPNNDLELFNAVFRAKQQITPKDSIYFQGIYSKFQSGDLALYYDEERDAQRSGRIRESQEPMLLAGYHHEWTPGIHTLFLAGKLQDTLKVSDFPVPVVSLFRNSPNEGISFVARSSSRLDYQSDFDLYTAELQQMFKVGIHTFVAGARYQNGDLDINSRLGPFSSGRFTDPSGVRIPIQSRLPGVSDHMTGDLERIAFYGYDTLRILDHLLVTVGLSYDRVSFPENFRKPPVSSGQRTTDQLSPKAGIIWTPFRGTTLRAAYSRSLGGASFDQSFQLEPSQVGGFNQAYRSLVPESVGGSVAGSRFETWGLALDQKFPSGTYFGVQAELLTSKSRERIGAFDASLVEVPSPDDTNFTDVILTLAPGGTQERISYYERNLSLTLNQLISDYWSVGARYRLSDANLKRELVDIASSLGDFGRTDQSAILHQVDMFVLFNHSSGIFSQFDALWSRQSNRGYNPEIPGDDFWQLNAFVGYRFPRRVAELRVGVLNLTDQNYKLNPLNLTAYLPRDRTFIASLKFSF